METNKITSHQLFSLTTTASIGGSILVIASSVANVAKQDAWISTLIAPAYGIIIIWMYFFLGSLFPGMTLIGICKSIFGKWFGSIVALGYISTFFITATHIPWYVGSFVGRMMHETPVYSSYFIFVTAMTIAILYGIEAVARASEFFLKFVCILFFTSMILLLPNIKFDNIKPILENGIVPALKGSLLITSFVTLPLTNIIMIYPKNIDPTPQAKKALFKGFLLSCLIVSFAITMCIFVLGSVITSRSNFPTLLLAQEISIGKIISRIEYIISLTWYLTQFAVGFSYFYSSAIGLSELIGLKDHKKIVLPMGLLILVIAGIDFPNSLYQNNWLITVFIPLNITFGIFLPVIMLILYLLKKRVFKK